MPSPSTSSTEEASLNRFDLSGEVAVVTGALGKLGPVWADALIDAGASVAAVDLEGVEPDDRFRSIEKRADGRLVLLRGDVRDRASLETARAACAEELGRPTVLVNNAGVDQPPQVTSTTRLEDWPLDAFGGVLDVNVAGTFLATQVFGGAMVAGGGGSVVNIGSLYASVSPDARFYDHIDADPPFLKPPAYGASKAAIVNLTRYFAAHWGPAGVRVNALSPGGVAGGQDDEFVAKFTARVPLGRLATDDDLGGALVFLASKASAYITGIELKVDGGFTCW